MSRNRALAYRFVPFRLDVRVEELTRLGCRRPLPRQSFLLLLALLEHPGSVVKRSDLRLRLWPDGTHVDWDHGLNNAAARLRRALKDGAAEPRFVETLPRVGYRFVAPVTAMFEEAGTDVVPSGPASPRPAQPRRIALAAAAVLLIALGVAAGRVTTPAARSGGAVSAAEIGARRHAEWSLVYTRLVLDGVLSANAAFPDARRHADVAVRLMPDLAEAHLASGYTDMWGRWRWETARTSFDHALALDRANARAWHGRALWFLARGQRVEARADIDGTALAVPRPVVDFPGVPQATAVRLS
jgi:DNA-binding winged helix-turn-helix (wHTH) protein